MRQELYMCENDIPDILMEVQEQMSLCPPQSSLELISQLEEQQSGGFWLCHRLQHSAYSRRYLIWKQT